MEQTCPQILCYKCFGWGHKANDQNCPYSGRKKPILMNWTATLVVKVPKRTCPENQKIPGNTLGLETSRNLVKLMDKNGTSAPNVSVEQPVKLDFSNDHILVLPMTPTGGLRITLHQLRFLIQLSFLDAFSYSWKLA